MTKTVLVYGDSNTYGQTNWPILTQRRLPHEQRWTSILEALSGGDLRIIAEGLGGRTAGDIQSGDTMYRNGQQYFRAIYQSHFPVDIVVIALGANDMKLEYGCSAQQVLNNLQWYQKTLGSFDRHESEVVPRIFYMTPQDITEASADIHNVYLAGQKALREEVVDLMASDEEMNIIEINEVATSIDNLHWSPEGHRKVAEILWDKLQKGANL